MLGSIAWGVPHAALPNDEALLAKSLKWAILSAQQPHPCLTVLLLPSLPNAPHTKFLNHPCVHKLSTIPARKPCLQTINGAGEVRVSICKYGMEVLLVGNLAGIASFIRLQHLQNFETLMHTTYRTVPSDPALAPLIPSKTFLRAMPALTRPILASVALHRPPASFASERMLCFGDANQVYTDGSKLESGAIGAGVYVPDLPQAS